MAIEGQVIVVTGAASGIGLATVEALTRIGARVTGVDLAEAPTKLTSDQGPTHAFDIPMQWRTGDVTILDDIAGIVREVVEREGRIDALIGCAGLSDQSSIETGDTDRWQEVLVVNALGPMVSVRAAIPHMLEQDHGDIVVVTSASGRITYVGEPAYVASKHAAVAFLDSARKEFSGTNIRITSIEPGLVDTPMIKDHPLRDSLFASVEPLQASDIADLIVYCLDLPRRVTINEVAIRPTRQGL